MSAITSVSAGTGTTDINWLEPEISSCVIIPFKPAKPLELDKFVMGAILFFWCREWKFVLLNV